MKNHIEFFQIFDDIPVFWRLPKAYRSIKRKIRTRLKYRNFSEFVQKNANTGFNGKWTKDEERTLKIVSSPQVNRVLRLAGLGTAMGDAED